MCQNHIQMPKNVYFSRINQRFLVEMTQRCPHCHIALMLAFTDFQIYFIPKYVEQVSESHKNAKKCIFFKNKSSILGGNDLKVPTLSYCVKVSIYRFLEIFYTENMFKKCQNQIKMPKNAYFSKISNLSLVEMTQMCPHCPIAQMLAFTDFQIYFIPKICSKSVRIK